MIGERKDQVKAGKLSLNYLFDFWQILIKMAALSASHWWECRLFDLSQGGTG